MRVARGWLLSVVLAGGFFPAGAAPADFPFEAVVKASRLHVRSGPGTNFTAVADVRQGERLTVVGEKSGWYKVNLPASCKLWVAAAYVSWQEGEPEGVVTGDDVNLRAAGSYNAETLAQLKKGDRLKVFRKRGDWLEAAPLGADVFAWVSAKYVEAAGAADPDIAEWLAIRRLYQEEMDKDIVQRRLDPVLARAEALAATCQNQGVKERLDLFLKQLREEAEWSRKLTATQEERAKAMREIQERYQAEMKRLLEQVPEASAFLLTGWLYETGNILGGAPGTHKLVKGGKVIAYVRGNNVDLSKYYGKYVGVNGEDSYHPRYREPVIVIQAESQIRAIGPDGKGD